VKGSTPFGKRHFACTSIRHKMAPKSLCGRRSCRAEMLRRIGLGDLLTPANFKTQLQ